MPFKDKKCILKTKTLVLFRARDGGVGDAGAVC
jgi:hypothetical protein